jgi:hypothetical protein
MNDQLTSEAIEHDDTQDESQAAQKLQKVWLHRITEEEKSHKDYRSRARDVNEVFNDDLGSDDELYVPLLWSVVQVEHNGIYSSQPVPDVRPANDEKNPVFRQASDILERGIAHFVDKQSFDENFHRTVDDYLAPGLGVIRVKLITEIIDVPIQQDPPPPDIAAEMDARDWEIFEEMSQQTEKGIGNQDIRWQYVPYDRFGWEPCNSWDDCDWIYFRHRMTQKQIKERFGRTLKASKDKHDKNDTNSWKSKTFDIYEVWDKKNRRQLYIAKGETTPVEVNKDPLGLPGFYPIPTPLMTNIPSSELIPKPDYDYIEPYDRELNRLQERRMALIEQIKAVGGHDQGMPELGDIYEQEDGQSLAIPNLAQRTQGGGFEAVMFQLPLEEKVIVLAKLTEQIQVVKAAVDEILGIADIVRGVSNAKEGVGTQELKGRWVGVRLSRKRDAVAYTVREMFRITAQLLTTHFTDENLTRLTQVELGPEVLQLLRNDLMMDFAIDIETDSTVAKDEFQERQTRQEMLGAVGQFAQSVLPMVQQNLLPADVSSAILRASLQPYAKYSRALDESMADLQTTMQQLQQQQQVINQTQQQLEATDAELQQWKQVAITLQNQATEASAAQKVADAGKKKAETQKIVSELEDQQLQPYKTAAETDKLRAETINVLRPDPPKQVQ